MEETLKFTQEHEKKTGFPSLLSSGTDFSNEEHHEDIHTENVFNPYSGSYGLFKSRKSRLGPTLIRTRMLYGDRFL
jgi:hypothetical protein